MTKYILSEGEHMPLQDLIDSTRRVTVDDRPAVFNPAFDNIITYTDPGRPTLRVTKKDLLFRGVWIGARTLIFEDRTLIFYPDATAGGAV